MGYLCIRTQFLITETQYTLGMIPHHSVHMSRKLLEREKNPFVHILDTQEHEIEILKGVYSGLNSHI